MSSIDRQHLETDELLRPNTRVKAISNFVGETPKDLSFVIGEKLTILKPDIAMYWYVAQNDRGQRGIIPFNLIEVIEEQPPAVPPPPLSRAFSHKVTPSNSLPPSLSIAPPPVPPRPGRNNSDGSVQSLDRLRSATHSPFPPPLSAPPQQTTAPPLPPVTGNPVPVVIDTINFRPPMPLPPNASGPQLHVTSPLATKFGKYSNSQSFVTNSGWFQPTVGMTLSTKLHIPEYVFRQMTSAVYFFQHKHDRTKDYVGKSLLLYNDLTQMFVKLYEKPVDQLNPLEEELRYSSPDADMWNVRAWSHPPVMLELEATKMIIKLNSLHPCGLNKDVTLESKEDFQKFCVWYTKERQRKKKNESTV